MRGDGGNHSKEEQRRGRGSHKHNSIQELVHLKLHRLLSVATSFLGVPAGKL